MTAKMTSSLGLPLACVEDNETRSQPEEELSVKWVTIRRTSELESRLEADGEHSHDTDGGVSSIKSTNAACAAQTTDNSYSQRPVVSDVKLITKRMLNTDRASKARTMNCVNDVTRIRSSNDDLPKPRPGRIASTFGHVTQHNVYIDMGEYKTLLRPTPATDQLDDVTTTHRSSLTTLRHVSPLFVDDTDDVTSSSLANKSAEEPPTPLVEYGDETIRAITLITEKFDSFRRHQLRVRSFIHQSRSVSSSTRSRTTANSVTTQSGRDGFTSRRSTLVRLADEHGIAFLASNTSGSTDDTSADGHVTATEIDRTWLFYSSVATNVVVCRSLADVSFGACATPSSGTGNGRAGRYDSTAGCKGWVHIVTGIPTLVLNTGACSSRRRELLVVIADRQTGLPVWRDRVSYLSEYHEVTAGVHAMRVSGGLTKRVKLDIFDHTAADEFLASYRSMTSDPADELWKMSADDESERKHIDRYRRNQRHRRQSEVRKALLAKSAISLPCHPRWVTRVNVNDSNFRSVFVDFLPPPSNEPADTVTDSNDVRTDGVDEEFRPRLPTN